MASSFDETKTITFPNESILTDISLNDSINPTLIPTNTKRNSVSRRKRSTSKSNRYIHSGTKVAMKEVINPYPNSILAHIPIQELAPAVILPPPPVSQPVAQPVSQPVAEKVYRVGKRFHRKTRGTHHHLDSVSKPRMRTVRIHKKHIFKCGRKQDKRIVSVYIYSDQDYKDLSNLKQELRGHTMHSIRAYLIEKNLIRFGSTAPENMLRDMYINIHILSGLCNTNILTKWFNYVHGAELST